MRQAPALLASEARMRLASWEEVKELVYASYEEQGIPHAPAPASSYLVLEKEGRIVGCQGWRKLSGFFTEFCHLYVLPSERGQGIAKALVGEALSRAPTPVVLTTVLRHNKASLRTLLSQGFKPVGEVISPYTGREIVVLCATK